jgi:hypothetical protein
MHSTLRAGDTSNSTREHILRPYGCFENLILKQGLRGIADKFDSMLGYQFADFQISTIQSRMKRNDTRDGITETIYFQALKVFPSISYSKYPPYLL